MHLDRIMLVLEAVAVAGRPVSTAELQGATGLPRPTCYRLLRSLARHRLLDDPEETSRYRIGERLVRLALLGRAVWVSRSTTELTRLVSLIESF